MSHTVPARTESGRPRRPVTPIVTPVVVLVCTLALITWSAWPVLRPSRSIDVTQAIALSANTQEQIPQSDQLEHSQSTRTVQAAGWLEAEPYYSIASALADGVIDEMLVLEGDQVSQGQVIARMVDDDAKLSLARAQANLDKAIAAHELASVHLESAERNWDSPIELERAVASTRASLEMMRAELDQLPSIIRTEQALLVKAEEELKRLEQAFRSDAVSEVEYIAAREILNAQAARVEAAERREPILRASIAKAESELLAATRTLELRIDDHERLLAARAQVRLAAAERSHREALRAEAELNLDRMTIRSPIDGFVQRRIKSPGDKVMLGMDTEHSSHIAHLYDPAKLQVRVDVPLADASQIFVGQLCEVVVEVLPDRVFSGEVVIVTHEADLQKNTLQIKVRVIDPDPILRPEMLTRVKFNPSGAQQTLNSESAARSSRELRVPAHVIDYSNGDPCVWVVADRANGQGTLQPVRIDILETDSEWVTVKADLQPGAIVASDPQDCAPGERVRIASSNGGAR